MTTLPTVALNDNPAVLDHTWLPHDTQFEELNDLAVAHRALIEELNELSRERARLRGKHEQEDQDREQAVIQAHRAGESEPPDKRTASAKREASLEASREQSRLKVKILEDLVARIVATIQEREREWMQSILEDEHRARQRVSDLRAELAKAEQVFEQTPKLRMWIERTALNRPGRHIQWRYLATPPTTDLLKIANEGRSPANSIPSPALTKEATTPLNDRDPKPEDYADETLDYSSEAYLSQLDEALRNHAKKRLAGESAPGAL
jgi:hypothetical protein